MPYAHRSKASSRRADILLIVGFFAILLYPGLSLFETPEAIQAKDTAEKRVLTPRPPIWKLAEEPSKFVADFKSFFDDQFEGRGGLVTLNSLVRLSLFHSSTSPLVLAGRHGALFFTGEPFVARHDFGHETAQYRRVLPVSERRLRRIHELLVTRKKWAEEMGAKFLFVVAPDKGTVYPEQMPAWMNRLREPSLTDQLTAYLRSTGDIDYIDLRPVLQEAKSSGRPLYYVGDSHWNHAGALVAYGEIARWLQVRFPSIKILEAEDLVRSRSRLEGDLAKILHLESHLAEITTTILPRSPRSVAIPFFGDPTPIASWESQPLAFRNPDDRLPKALIYNDSFFGAMTPFLAECFQTSVFIRDRRVVKSSVKGYKPDVVIFECVERGLYPLAYRTDDLLPLWDPELVAEHDDLLKPQTR